LDSNTQDFKPLLKVIILLIIVSLFFYKALNAIHRMQASLEDRPTCGYEKEKLLPTPFVWYICWYVYPEI